MSPVTLRVVIHEESSPKVITGQSAKRLTGKNLILLNDTQVFVWSLGLWHTYAENGSHEITICLLYERPQSLRQLHANFKHQFLDVMIWEYILMKELFDFMQYADLCEEDSPLMKPVLADLEAGSAFELAA